MVRFAAVFPVAVAVFFSAGIAAPAAAQQTTLPAPHETADLASLDPVLASPPPALAADRASHRRPTALIPLYASFATLQALDLHSTHYALGRGAVEANPLMGTVANNEVGLMAIKAAGTAGVIFASERMWTRNKAAAVVFMIAANSAMAWVVQHNYRAVR
jgi:Domain of unknown function (DUF5658)